MLVHWHRHKIYGIRPWALPSRFAVHHLIESVHQVLASLLGYWRTRPFGLGLLDNRREMRQEGTKWEQTDSFAVKHGYAQ